MKIYSEDEIEAFANGTAMDGAAVWISGPTEFLAWTGHGQLDPELVFGEGAVPAALADKTFVGLGQHGLVKATGGGLGGAAQGLQLVLSGVDPTVLDLVPLAPWRRAPVVVWRLTFNGAGSVLLGAHVHQRGRIDDLVREDTPGAASTINAMVEGAARTAGRFRGRTRSDPDQRLVSASDGGFKHVTYAGEKKLQLGGERPITAGSMQPGDHIARPGPRPY